jgi:hypothetical protein
MSDIAPTGNSNSPSDDLSQPIADGTRLYRRVPKNQVTEDEDLSGNKTKRPTSACFTDNSSPMSLYDADMCGVDEVMSGNEDFLLISLTASQVRSLGLELKRTSSGGRGHCEAVGKKTGGIRSKLAKMAVWVVPPSQP